MLLVVIAAGEVSAQEKQFPKYPDAVAVKHAGEEAIVTGKVVAVTTSNAGTTYLNFGDHFPRQTFSAVISARDHETIGNVKPFEGKTVAVTGKIGLSRQGKSQIVVRSRAQIAIEGDPAPAAEVMPKELVALGPPPVSGKHVPETEPPEAMRREQKIVLGSSWNRPAKTGELTRKDLALIFSTCGQASEDTAGDSSIMVYPSIAFLTPVPEAKRQLRLDGLNTSKAKVVCPGLPLDSFWSHAFDGVFPGGYDRLCLISDAADQVISVQLVETTSRQRSSGFPDLLAYHTYNFISYRVKGNARLAIKHEVAKSTPGVFVVDSSLIDPYDHGGLGLKTAVSRTPGRTQSRSTRTGKVLERSRWFVPVPVVNLILRCVGDR